MKFENVADPEGHQAVALHVTRDKAAFFDCKMEMKTTHVNLCYNEGSLNSETPIPSLHLAEVFITAGSGSCFSQDFLFEDVDADGAMYNGETTNLLHGGDEELRSRSKHSDEIIMLRLQSGKICS
ncbi:hypothetical protein NE237_005162 [Protea cynaroides]|uniref:Uncharacterized protein n=1 Tax=Protea cynaroides TaxID=273540 RepID=A0A9Q0KK03_9MAGN|nr:hypothetical protein NE237_005162 [Protea cynaroides]